MMHTLESLLARTEEDGDCLLWMGCMNNRGVPQVHHGDSAQPVRRVICALSEIPIKPGYVVSNTCGNPRCIEPSHLAIRSPKQHARAGVKNRNQAITNALIAKTRRKQSSPLDSTQVAEIRSSGEKPKILAERYGVNPRTINRIQRGASWRELSSPWAGLGA